VQALGPAMRLARFYAEHTILGNYDGQRGSVEWQMNWKAPSSDLGPVTFYAAGNAANGDHTDFFDYIYTTNVTIDGLKRIVHVSLTDPTSSAVIGSGEKATIRWTATDGDSGGPVSFRITLSTDGGENYPSVIADALPGDARSFVWTVPDALVTEQARIRVTAIDPEGLEHAASSRMNISIHPIGLDNAPGIINPNQGTFIHGVAMSDYDGDGRVDAAFARAGGGVLVAHRSPTGVLDDVTSAAGIDDITDVRAVAWGDIDNDGKPDLAVASAGSTAIYHNLGGGQFEHVGAPTMLPRVPNPKGIAWIDLDRDGRLDLVIAATDSVIALRNSGTGEFTDVTAQLGLSGIPVDAVAGGPLLALGGENGLKLFRFDGTRYTDVTAESGAAVTARTNAIVWADIDGDGRLDIVAATTQGVRVLKGIGGQGVRFVDIGASLGLGTSGPSVAALAVGDYDADGDVDLVLVDGAGSPTVYRNNQTSGFSAVTERFTLASRVEGAVFADLDGSGAVDLVLVGATIDAYTNPRSGGTGLAIQAASSDGTFGVPRDAVGATVRVDLDGDGDWSTGPQAASVVTGAGLPVLVNVPGGGSAGVRVDFVRGNGFQVMEDVASRSVVIDEPQPFTVGSVRVAGTSDAPKLVVDGAGIPAVGGRIEVDDVGLSLVKAPKKKVMTDGTTTRLVGKDPALGVLTATRPVAVRVVNPTTGVLSAPVLLR
ncbi:MAG TPA: FG-GAP-like repeat-containing protein, partial [Blastocatellia bacterium]|nr:FG-GAP-like repeat-containing protein [Blastocatellia bacterium]